MAKDYAAISKKIVENIGGVENIASVKIGRAHV